jgi:hypothetical protein
MRVCSSSAANGSSISRMSVSLDSPRATIHALAHADGKLVREVIGELSHPYRFERLIVRSRHSARATPRYLKFDAEILGHRVPGNSVLSWNTNAILSGRDRERPCPAPRPRPSSVRTSPPMMLSSVLFAAARGPSRSGTRRAGSPATHCRAPAPSAARPSPQSAASRREPKCGAASVAAGWWARSSRLLARLWPETGPKLHSSAARVS